MRLIMGAMTIASIMAATTASAADLSQKLADRVKDAASTLKEIHAVPDKDIPSGTVGEGVLCHRRPQSEEGRLHRRRRIRQGVDELPGKGRLERAHLPWKCKRGVWASRLAVNLSISCCS